MKQEALLSRKEVPGESMWNSEALYPSWDAWEAEYEMALADLPNLSAFENRLGEGPGVLLSWFEECARQWDREVQLFVYADMAASVDSGDTEAKAHRGQALGLWARLEAATAFAEPELTALGERLSVWLAEEPALRDYRHYFSELLRMAPHRRSAEVEEVLGMLLDAFINVSFTAEELTNTDLTFADAVDSQGKKHPVHQATLPPTGIKSPDRERRRTAWESFCNGHLSVQNTLASNYVTKIKQVVALARIRQHESVLEMMLAPSDLPVSVFHNVIDTFKAELPTWHRYWGVRRKALGVDELRPFDIWTPLAQEEVVIPYRQGVAWICEALAPLGEAYVETVRQACLKERWVDYAPNKEKRQGAASYWATPDTPPVIVTGYEGSTGCLSVLAHELGHSLHSYECSRTQPYVYRHFASGSLAVAETASNFHQAMVRAHLQDVGPNDRGLRLALLDETLENFHRYFFIMPILAQFELEVFRRAEQRRPLSAPILNQIMADLFAEGYGSALADDPERTQITWAQFPHLYRPFYTFQYAVGIAAAHALAERVRAGGPDAAERYLHFLRAGSSRSPLALFELAGVDMTTPQPVERAFAALSAQIDQVEALAA